MLQIIKSVLKDKEDTTKVSLLFANQTEEDILLRSVTARQQWWSKGHLYDEVKVSNLIIRGHGSVGTDDQFIVDSSRKIHVVTCNKQRHYVYYNGVQGFLSLCNAEAKVQSVTFIH